MQTKTVPKPTDAGEACYCKDYFTGTNINALEMTCWKKKENLKE